ncbi:TPA: transcriptional regulator [Escherichia coli]|nr:transcriptional regulator [Escherichia coli]HAX5120658.1 transcriptional regulator [Escherichia coli]HAX5130819.1 transcriptional regulator [Escherichia coli]HAX5181638.1 transcriptional regulator [Escherichia coli]HAX5228324.1 transcriptional regulator [Escherichia coli]
MRLSSNERYSTPGSMSVGHFRCLIEISSINSQKVISALEDFFVHGKSRKEACERNNVAQGYFSISMSKFLKINNIVAQVARFYRR